MTRQIVIIINLFLSLIFVSAAHGEVSKGTFKLGVSAPLTGSVAAAGFQIKAGVEQAVEDINQEGGILGQKIELIITDDASDPRQAVAAANHLISKNIIAVIGNLNSHNTEASGPRYAEANILQFTPASTSAKITESGWSNMFRLCGRDDQQAEVTAQYIAEHFKDQIIAIFHDKTAFGKGMAEATQKALHARGIKEVLFAGVNSGEKDYFTLVSKLKEIKADILYWGGAFSDGGMIVRQMREQGVKTRMMGGDALMSTEFLALGGEGTEGTLATYASDPRRHLSAQKLIERFAKKKFQAESFAFFSYAAVQVLKQAAEETGSLEFKILESYLHSGKIFETVVGPVSFKATGDRKEVIYVMFEWRRGPEGKINYFEVGQKTDSSHEK